MRFAHIADCHLGGWRDYKMRELVVQSFRQAIKTIIEEKVDFVLICGDMFNTAIPGIDIIKEAVTQLKKLKSAGIPVYVIPGSHDYSPSGKTVIDVLEEAEFCKNVFKGTVEDNKLFMKFTQDKSGVKLCGILGKRGELERHYYEMLDLKSLENEPGTKIFLYHSPIEEFKSGNLHMMEALPLSSFPKGFNYYAGGHVHTVMHKNEKGYGTFAYPGPLFPNSFSELEELKCGGFYIVDLQENPIVKRYDIKLKDVVLIVIDCGSKTASEVSDELIENSRQANCKDAIVLIRLFGVLASGSVADIRFREASYILYSNGAYFVMRNTRQLESSELTIIERKAESVEEIENSVIQEHSAQISLPGELQYKEAKVMKQLLSTLSEEKGEGETQTEYEKRLTTNANRILRLQ